MELCKMFPRRKSHIFWSPLEGFVCNAMLILRANDSFSNSLHSWEWNLNVTPDSRSSQETISSNYLEKYNLITNWGRPVRRIWMLCYIYSGEGLVCLVVSWNLIIGSIYGTRWSTELMYFSNVIGGRLPIGS